MFRSLTLVGLATAMATGASAQPVGTFRWQTQPYCNVITVSITKVDGVYTLDGFDDQCDSATRAPVTGAAVPNPDGTIQFALDVVASPGGASSHLSVPLDLRTFGGPWKDDAGHTGAFTLLSGNPVPGSLRPSKGLGVAAIDTTQIQQRVGPPCAQGGVIQGIGQNGSVLCKPGMEQTASGAADISHANGLVLNQTALPHGGIPWSGHGRRLMWYPGKAAFRAGEVTGQQWDDGNVGYASAALGLDAVAKGDYSVAFGHNATATAQDAVALGRSTLADAHQAVAIGNFLSAAGSASVALGTNAATTSAAVGSFVFGDASSQNTMVSFFPNEFKARAAGGTTFYSNAALTTGVKLASNASAWSSLSDANSKEHFKDLDGADVLARIARMPIREWNYKAQDAAIRHVGPTAQDFAAAFGLGEDPLRISTIDADGIALRAIQALEARTRVENEALRVENGELRSVLEALRARLDALERARK
ncbi:MAG: tail fiber domain-containing protein [Vicinamibacterales bacterium]